MVYVNYPPRVHQRRRVKRRATSLRTSSSTRSEVVVAALNLIADSRKSQLCLYTGVCTCVRVSVAVRSLRAFAFVGEAGFRVHKALNYGLFPPPPFSFPLSSLSLSFSLASVVVSLFLAHSETDSLLFRSPACSLSVMPAFLYSLC